MLFQLRGRVFILANPGWLPDSVVKTLNQKGPPEKGSPTKFPD